MKKTKRFLAIILAVTLIICSVSCLGLTAFAEAVTSGTCGKNLTWKYNTETYTLEISGSGVMNNYIDHDGLTTAPWNNFYNRMKTLIIGDNVTQIGSSAFCGCTGLTSIEIPDSVTSIGDGAFVKCTGLKSIEIPISVTSIGSYAFPFCTGLTSIEIPDSVTSIGEDAFRFCTGLKTVTIGHSVTSIGNGAFYNCTGLKSIEIPDSVTSIGEGAFEYCTGLTSIQIPKSVTSIDSYAFSGCAELESIIIPDSVTSIGACAFLDCEGLIMVTIGNSVTSIGDNAFNYCTGLTSIEIPDSVTSIGSYAFCNCAGLTSIEIPDSVTSIGGLAFECTAWYNSKPNGLVYAGKVAYKYKGSMPSNTSIVLKDGTLGIAGSAFSDCYGLTSIEIPNSVTSIGEGAFYNCTGLKTVKYIGTKEQWDKIKIGLYNEPLIKATLEIITGTAQSPENLTCTAYTKATLTLSWDKVDGVKGYKIYNVTTGKSYKIKGADNTTYKIQNLKECKNYDFQICYFENDGNSDVYGEYSQSFRYCTRPSGVTVTEINNSSSDTKHSFTVTHSTVKNVSGYEVKYQLVGAKNYKTYNRTAHTAKTVEVAKAGTYKVWIRAYKSAKYDGVNKFKANGDWSESYTIEVK